MSSLDDQLEIDPDDADQQLAIALAEADSQLLERLVALRRAKGLTQEGVALKMRRHQTAISHFERTGSDPHMSTVRRYALAIGAEVTHEVRDCEAPAPIYFKLKVRDVPLRMMTVGFGRPVEFDTIPASPHAVAGSTVEYTNFPRHA